MMQTFKKLGMIFLLMLAFYSCCQRNRKDLKADSNENLKIDSQKSDEKFTFIDYDEVISELKTNKNFKSIEYKYNYTFILLLDSSEINLIKRLKPEVIEDFKDLPKGFQPNEITVGFVTEKKNIKDIFNDKSVQKRILGCLNIENSSDIENVNIHSTVYIKGNKAIFEIYGPFWSVKYLARLNYNVLQINWFEEIIE